MSGLIARRCLADGRFVAGELGCKTYADTFELSAPEFTQLLMNGFHEPTTREAMASFRGGFGIRTRRGGKSKAVGGSERQID